jgi:hypothetical protein
MIQICSVKCLHSSQVSTGDYYGGAGAVAPAGYILMDNSIILHILEFWALFTSQKSLKIHINCSIELPQSPLGQHWEQGVWSSQKNQLWKITIRKTFMLKISQLKKVQIQTFLIFFVLVEIFLNQNQCVEHVSEHLHKNFEKIITIRSSFMAKKQHNVIIGETYAFWGFFRIYESLKLHQKSVYTLTKCLQGTTTGVRGR